MHHGKLHHDAACYLSSTSCVCLPAHLCNSSYRGRNSVGGGTSPWMMSEGDTPGPYTRSLRATSRLKLAPAAVHGPQHHA